MNLIRLIFNFLINLQYHMTFKSYEKNQWKDRSTIEKLQLERLNHTLLYAYNNFEFYRTKWDNLGIKPNIKSIDEIKKFPITTKSDLLPLVKKFDKSDHNLIWLKTTGSTGEPFTFPTRKKDETHKKAVKQRIKKWVISNQNYKKVKFWRGTSKKTLKQEIKEILKNEYTLSIYDPDNPKSTLFDRKRINYFIKELNNKKPDVIDGFVSALDEIANFLLSNEIKLNFIPKVITTGAEKLSKEQRKTIERAFKAKILNRYGGTETSIIAHECEEQSKTTHYLHIQEDRVYVENNSKNEIIFTDLTSRTFPFIRYNTNDIGKIYNDYKCNCNRNFGIIKEVEGRVNEWFTLENGDKISSHIWQNYFKSSLGIRKYQIIQMSKNHFKINWIKNQEYFNEKEFNEIKILITEALKSSIIEWEEKDYLELGKGGKFNQHISLVK